MPQIKDEEYWNSKFLYPSYLSFYSPVCCHYQTPRTSRSAKCNATLMQKRRLIYSDLRDKETWNVKETSELNQNFNYSTDSDYTLIEIPQNNWEFLSSPEWKEKLNETPLEPCFAETEEPTSWVNMTAVEPPDEFWTQELDFESYEHVIDYLKGICENKKQITYPRKIVNLINVHNIPINEYQALLLQIRETYLNKGLLRWAEELGQLSVLH